ncbi:general secretion pathway protein GspC [Leptospira yasudae]|uniref:General secretion pathway protein GspC n=1 Tax=Leptospira yasudae TaxID=2202201 RepID=A0A6N4QU41_9LEPT|nr:general secretion pathway protein GspC [Leptospira yasudae]TGL77992.1 general secretion pathway protein GspC [Leptospira yasudae]TGL82335.1 general secretion pathway protein GspC [Leptospira yasudae]TGL88994.1 general secretion pathway protein GspC [Leptospira yasudae]
MNAIFLELRKNTFYTLIPVILFFSYSLSYLLRAVILAFLNPTVQAASSNSAPVRKMGPETNRALSSYEEMVQGNLIRGIASRAGDVQATEGEMSTAPPDTGEGEEMKVTGTLSGHWSFARVTIVEKGKPEAQEFATGETVGGYKIKSIALNYVVLEKGGIALKVEIGQTPGEARAKLNPEAGAKADGAPSGGGDTIRKVLSRQDVNRKLKDPAAIYKNARFGPALINGKISGYKIYSVAPDHIFYALGARNGDIIKRVNGMPLTETEKMLEIWGAVKTADKITVDVERGSQILTYEFIIRN